MKYAIVEDGGKQYTAVEGGTIEVDFFESEPGDEVNLQRVLMIVDGDKVSLGKPILEKANVKASVVSQFKGPKLTVFRYKPKKRVRVKTGHRQKYTRLQIEAIAENGK